MTTLTLTDTQRVVLAAAAARQDGAVLPLPTTLKLAGAARDRLLGAMLDKQLLVERPCSASELVWRRSRYEVALALHISDAGLLAIGIEPSADGSDARTTAPSPADGRIDLVQLHTASPSDATSPSRTTLPPSLEPRPTQPAPGSAPSKQDKILAALRQPSGAALAELMQATGWQAHSVRGFLSATVSKKLGLDLVSEKVDGVRRYRIAAASEKEEAKPEIDNGGASR